MVFGIVFLLITVIGIGSLPAYFWFTYRNKKAHPYMMRDELLKWWKQGHITEEDFHKLSSLYPIPTKRSSISLLQIVYFVGSILIGIGAILFIASNWEKLAGWFKLSLVGILAVISLFLGDYFKHKKKSNLPVLGEGLLLLASILWGVVIIFLFQYFHMAVSFNWLLLLIWMISVFPVAIWMKSEPTFYLLILLSFLWGIFCKDWLTEAYWAFFLVSIGLFFLSKDNRVKEGILAGAQYIMGFFFVEQTLQAITYWLLVGLFHVGLSVWRKRKADLVYSLVPLLLAGIFTMIFFFDDNPGIFHWSWIHWTLSIGAVTLTAYQVWKHQTMSGLVLWLLAFYTGIWSFFAAKSTFGEVYIGFVAAIAFVLFSLSLLLQKKSRLFPVWLFMGHFLVWIPLFLLSSKGIQDSILHDPFSYRNDPTALIRITFSALISLGFLIATLYHILQGTKRFQWRNLFFFAVCLGLALLSLMIYRDYRLFVINFALLFTIIQSFFWSYEEDQPALFYLGMVALLVFILLRYFDFLWSLLDRSVFFVFGGVMLVIIAVFIEQQRRKLDIGEEKHENS